MKPNYRLGAQNESGSIAVPVWKRVALPEALFSGAVAPVDMQESVSQGVLCTDVRSASPLFEVAEHLERPEMSTYVHGLGTAFSAYITREAVQGRRIELAPGQRSGAVTLTYTWEAHAAPRGTLEGLGEVRSNSEADAAHCAAHHVDAHHVDRHQVVARAGENLTVLVDYRGSEQRLDTDDLNKSIHYGTTEVVAEAGSRVKVILIQRVGAQQRFFHQVLSKVETGAELEMVDIQLGAALKAVAYETHLAGEGAKAFLHTLYFGNADEQIDVAYTMRHIGAHSESVIETKGALSGNSKKVFRGNLLFDRGARQSVGREEEATMLLDASVRSDSIPALMCDEDDVIGEHAASIGQMDAEKMFYLMSRGLSPEEAKRLVVKGSFESVLGHLEAGALRDALEQVIDRRIVDESH